MQCFTQSAWRNLWEATRIPGDGDFWFKNLDDRYAEEHRHYHTAHHIDECLSEFENARPEASNPLALALAIWFHDAIYDPHHADNEEQSAELAVECLKEANPQLSQLVHRLILTTKHHVAVDIPDADLLIDVDLAILGKPPPRFAEYEKQIREEYSWVPLSSYKEKRSEILHTFLGRQRIFTTEIFHSRYEDQARSNLVYSISQLRRRLMLQFGLSKISVDRNLEGIDRIGDLLSAGLLGRDKGSNIIEMFKIRAR